MTNIYYTIVGKTDGFGAQYQAILSGIAYCKFKNYIYIHTPFLKMEHDVNINKLNIFIGINNNLLINNETHLLKKVKIIKEDFSKEVHYSKNPSIYYTPEILKIIRQYYFSTDKPKIENIDIAIHIRRGDVSAKDVYRYTDNSTYINIINQLKIKYPFYTITIFSEGNYEDFKEFEIEEKYLKLNTCICETFHSLVSSKVLIMAKSSFSYCAGLLNENIIYYSTIYHDNLYINPLDHWLNIDSLIKNMEHF